MSGPTGTSCTPAFRGITRKTRSGSRLCCVSAIRACPAAWAKLGGHDPGPLPQPHLGPTRGTPPHDIGGARQADHVLWLRHGQHRGTIPYPPSVNLAGNQMRCSLDPIPLADHHEPPDSKRPGVTSCAHRRMSLGVPASLGTRNHAEDDPGRPRSPPGTA